MYRPVDGLCLRVLEWLHDGWPDDPENWARCARGHELVAGVREWKSYSPDRHSWDVVLCWDGSSLWRKWGHHAWDAVPSDYPESFPMPVWMAGRALWARYLLGEIKRSDEDVPF